MYRTFVKSLFRFKISNRLCRWEDVEDPDLQQLQWEDLHIWLILSLKKYLKL